jgi:hypothetical protein
MDDKVHQKILDSDRKAQAILADLITLVGEEAVYKDPEFLSLLDRAIQSVEFSLAEAKGSSNGVRRNEMVIRKL